MLFIDDKKVENLVKIPKNNYNFLEEYVLRLKSQATNKEYSFEVEDLSGLTDYYVFNLDFSTVQDGEYEYSVSTDKGLIQIGPRTSSLSAYTINNTYKQYKYGKE